MKKSLIKKIIFALLCFMILLAMIDLGWLFSFDDEMQYSHIKKFVCVNINQKEYRPMECTPSSDYMNAYLCADHDFVEPCG